VPVREWLVDGLLRPPKRWRRPRLSMVVRLVDERVIEEAS